MLAVSGHPAGAQSLEEALARAYVSNPTIESQRAQLRAIDELVPQASPAVHARWFEEVWNQRRTDTIDELLTDESVSHTDSGPLRGKQEFKEKAQAVFLSAFPDLRMTVEGTVAEGAVDSQASRSRGWATLPVGAPDPGGSGSGVSANGHVPASSGSASLPK